MATTLDYFHNHLHIWYKNQGRVDLPWRNTTDPYSIYLSEIMLQQTQVKTVLERYYFQFLQRFPTLQSLAMVDQNDVLQAWQGLGYYNRALNMHKTAQLCSNGLPDSINELMELPGIGQNTAHAIAAFAFMKPVPVMEANLKRVISRVFALKTPTPKELWARAHNLLDYENSFDYNQAMMDLGALICTNSAPKCNNCPAKMICKGKDAPENYPALKAKKIIKIRKKKIIVLSNTHDHYYATTRSGRFLNGLFHFVEINADGDSISIAEKKYLLQDGSFLGNIRQQYSHFTLEAEVWLLDKVAFSCNNWYSLMMLKNLPMSMAEQKILTLLQDRDKVDA